MTTINRTRIMVIRETRLTLLGNRLNRRRCMGKNSKASRAAQKIAPKNGLKTRKKRMVTAIRKARKARSSNLDPIPHPHSDREPVSAPTQAWSLQDRKQVSKAPVNLADAVSA